MIRSRGFVTLLLLLLMAAFGFGTYTLIGNLRTASTIARVVDPLKSKTQVALPGSILLSQNGALYKLQGGSFTQLTPANGWQQPAVLPNHNIVAVQRHSSYSNIAVLSPTGHLINWLTNFADPADISNAHWGFYPVPVQGSNSIFFSYDQQGAESYNVTFSIWSLPIASSPLTDGVQWSSPNPYQGGDVQPVGTPGGGVIYSKFAINSTTGATYSQLYYQASATDPGNYLTPPSANCEEPALNPAATELAMICINDTAQTSALEIAPISNNGTTYVLGPARVIPSAVLPAVPAWSPNGKSLIFLSPATKGAPFQLWVIQNPLAAQPSPAQQVTTGFNLDATSTPVWTAG